jgi:hypothetical protein
VVVTIKKKRISKEEQQQQNMGDDLCVLLLYHLFIKVLVIGTEKMGKEPQTHTDLATA